MNKLFEDKMGKYVVKQKKGNAVCKIQPLWGVVMMQNTEGSGYAGNPRLIWDATAERLRMGGAI